MRHPLGGEVLSKVATTSIACIAATLGCSKPPDVPEVDPRVQQAVLFGEWRSAAAIGFLRVVVVSGYGTGHSTTAYLQWLATRWKGDIGYPGQPLQSTRIEEITNSVVIENVEALGVHLSPSQFEIRGFDVDTYESVAFCGSSNRMGVYTIESTRCESRP